MAKAKSSKTVGSKPKTLQVKPVKKKPSTKKGDGRPRGRKDIPRDEVTVMVSRCKACGSTNRESYKGRPIVQRVLGKDPAGNPITHTIFRRTVCTDCGQARRDVSYMYDPSKSASQVEREQAEQG